MHKAEEYRHYAHQCELQLAKAKDLRVRAQLRRERQEWLELAASREAADLGRKLPEERPLDEDMTLSALRALERSRQALSNVVKSTPIETERQQDAFDLPKAKLRR